ncbi:MAG TPA: hypothetical protein VGL91_00180 [Acidobacteriota bacterium]
MTHIGYHESQTLCPACDIGPFIRNHYFTGKLMLERDFSDETRFHIEKLRHHHQRLHGWGVVCGLKVKQHSLEQCRDRFICIEAGTAIDCCGHEIFVREEECVDITVLEAIKALKKKESEDPQSRRPHTLQVCIRYRECPTEEIPVLYDECGCDDTKCAPNRILESYDIDVIVDPPPPPDSPHAPQLAWNNNVTLLADVSRIALHEAGDRLYMLVGDDVYQVETTTPIVGPNFHLAAKGLELAVSDDGKHLFVVTEPPTGSPTNLRQLVVLKTSDMTQVRALDIANSVNSDIRLAIASDKRLIVLVGKPGDVLIWTVAKLTGTPAPPAPITVKLATTLQDLAVASDAKHAYAVGTGSTKVIKLVNLTGAGSLGTDITVLPATAKATGIAVVRSTGADLLAIIDHDGKTLYLVRPDPVNPNASQVFPVVSLDNSPVGLAISTGGNWAYVLERDTAAPEKSFVQAVDLFRLSQSQAVTAGKSLQVGDASQQIVVSESGALLYVPYLGATANVFDGGVAKIEIKNLACEDLLWEHLNGCPHCDVPNCVVLATIKDYRVGDRIDDGKIDNRAGRRLLPSTQVLTELIECLRDHGPGGVGKQGPPGIQGIQGPPGVGERGLAGPAGPGLEEGLTQIVALSWRHNKQSPLRPITDLAGANIGEGIIIGLSNPVSIPNETEESAADHVFQVLVQHDLLIEDEPRLGRRGVICRCPVQGRILPVKPNTLTGLITSAQQTTSPAKGLAFVFRGDIAERIRAGFDLEQRPIELWVRLRGDFVLDDVVDPATGLTVHRAVDAEFVRAELPTGDRPIGSKFGIQGGLFESWFQIRHG